MSLWGVVAGVSLALILSVLSTVNPASIPLRRYAVRAAFGFVGYFVVWVPVCLLLSSPFMILSAGNLQSVLISTFIGLSVPHLVGGAKDRFLSRRLASGNRPLRLLLALAHSTDGITRRYFQRIINREERKANIDLMREMGAHGPGIVSELFALCAQEIADQRGIAGIVKAKQVAVQFKLVLRHLGYEYTVREMRRRHAILLEQQRDGFVALEESRSVAPDS